MDHGINFINAGFVVLDLLLVWACFSVDAHLRCQDAEEQEYQLGERRLAPVVEDQYRSARDW